MGAGSSTQTVYQNKKETSKIQNDNKEQERIVHIPNAAAKRLGVPTTIHKSAFKRM